MPNVLNEFTGDGVTRNFNFSMTGGYLSRDYVYFFTRPDDDLLNYTPYDDDNITWVSDYTVRTAAPIPVGTTFVVIRSTPLDPLVDFQNTSRITEKNLDTATWQSIHIAAETSDTVGRIQVVAQDAKQESSRALAGAQSAALDALRASQAAVSASAAASAAQVAALQAGTDASAAAQSAATATSVANAAASAAATANATANAAAGTANSALSTAISANSTANSAASQAGTAVSTANTALSTANSAASTAAGAVVTANSAAGTANTALTIANEAKDLVDEAVAGAVVSFNGRSGIVTAQAGDYTKAMVGLNNVDNTPDLEKPISVATSNALGLKADKSYVDTQLATKADSASVANALALKADSTAVNNALALKANTTDVNSALASNAAADRNRANHTGTQAMSTVSGLSAALANPSTVESINGGQIGHGRNIIVNGQMMLSHESAAIGKTTGFWYPVDCFSTGINLPTSCTTSGTRIDVTGNGTTLPYGFTHAFRLSAATWNSPTFNATANVYAAVQQSIEGYSARRLIGTPFTLSFYVRGSKSGTGYVSFRSGKANRGYTVPFTITAGTEWSRVTITVPTGLPTNWTATETDWGDGNGMQVCWVFAASSQFKVGSNNSWVTGNVLMPTSGGNYFTNAGDTVDITGVQLEVGSVATSYEYENYRQVIDKVNRYVCLIDAAHLIRVTGNDAWGGATTFIPWPTRMVRVPDVFLTRINEANAVDIQASDTTYAGTSVGYATAAPAGSWTTFSVLAKAYITN